MEMGVANAEWWREGAKEMLTVPDKSKALCIIPCGSRKIWDKNPSLSSVEADRAYMSPFHRFCKDYAKMFFEHWVILSAKYGFLYPADIVEGPYDVNFSRPSPDKVSFGTLQEQARVKQLLDFQAVVVLAGQKYRKPVTEVFREQAIQFPFEPYKGIGYIQQALKHAIATGNPLHE
jgi:hypothetical protein